MRRHLEKLIGLLGPLLLRLRRQRGPTVDELWVQAQILSAAERDRINRGWPLLTTAQQEVAYLRIRDTITPQNMWNRLEDSGVDVGDKGRNG